MDDALTISRQVYDLLVTSTTVKPPALRTWTGQTWGPTDADSTLVLQHPGALRAALFPPSDLVAGEAYVYDDIDIEGDLIEFLQWAAQLDALRSSRRTVLKLVRLLRLLPTESRRREAVRPLMRGRLHSMRRDRDAIRHHYDTGNVFFEQFLDPEMVYSSAYFLEPDEKLADAQRRKLDLICRKMQLQPGQRILDVGCGWGSLVRHAASNYGVEAVGITLSPEQAAEARKRNQLFGLADQVTIEVQDYRDATGSYDAISSVGMFEHVGGRELDRYFHKLHDLLAPGGTLLNHGITNRSRQGRFTRSKPSFINTYVFPDGELLPLEASIASAEEAGFETRDVESLRTSYALTLRHWVNNLEENLEAATAAADPATFRIWRMYMAGSAVAFELGAISVYQTIYTKAARPWTLGRTWATSGDDLG